MENHTRGFEIRGTNNGQRGYWTTFANGWTVSVQFGSGNYCENRSSDFSENADVPMRSDHAEIAAWDKDGNWHRFVEEHDDVKGWQTPEQVAAFTTMIAAK